MTMKFIFGPVPSRRLGISLGIDPIPFKTCSYDCIYCETGKTTLKTIERKPYHQAGVILEELRQVLAQSSALDFITISGSGEPTLNTELGELISGIREQTSIPLAVITNGSLLIQPEVREALAHAQVVIPSLDAVEESIFQVVNRPHPKLSLPAIKEGLLKFREGFPGKLWLEILLVRGINDDHRHLKAMRSFIEVLKPDKVQLNTVVRPPLEEYAAPLNQDQLLKAAEILGERVEMISHFSKPPASPAGLPAGDEILEMIGRRPCTSEDVALALGMPTEEVISVLNQLMAENKAAYTVFNRKGFYRRKG
jgi:wyosine [tRNA(Phe)-imidazoG37] synthetase (radical SAM superfamily)